MKKNVLLLAGLLVAGLGLAGCATEPETDDSKTSSSSSQVEEDLGGNESSNTEVEVDPLDPSVIAYPERTKDMPAFFKADLTEGAPFNMKGFAEFVILNEKYCMVDVTMGDFSDRFDARGTYTFENNVLTATVYMPTAVAGGDPVPAARTTFVSTYDADTQTYSLDNAFAIRGGLVFEFLPFTNGKWVNNEKSIAGTFDFTTKGDHPKTFHYTSTLQLLNGGKAVLDQNCASFAADNTFNKTFDKEGTFSIKEGKITCTFGTGEAASTLELVAGEDGKLAGTYALAGEEVINIALKGTFPGAEPVVDPAPDAGTEGGQAEGGQAEGGQAEDQAE